MSDTWQTALIRSPVLSMRDQSPDARASPRCFYGGIRRHSCRVHRSILTLIDLPICSSCFLGDRRGSQKAMSRFFRRRAEPAQRFYACAHSQTSAAVNERAAGGQRLTDRNADSPPPRYSTCTPSVRAVRLRSAASLMRVIGSDSPGILRLIAPIYYATP